MQGNNAPNACNHLGYLDQAIERASPSLFLDYIGWAKIQLQSLGGPGQELEASLACLRDAIATEVGDPSDGAIALLDEAIAALPTMPDEIASQIDPTSPHAELAKHYLKLLLAGQRRDARKLILDAVDNGAEVTDIYLGVFQPVQYEIGRLWQTNQVTVAQEHVCTAATQLIMSQLYDRIFSGDSNGMTFVSACVADDLHEIGARILTDFFEMAGWDTHYVGASTPANDMAALVTEVGADVAALSVTMVAHIPRAEGAIAAIRAASPNTRIIVGGYPFLRDAGLCQRLGADGTATNAADAVRVATELVKQ